MQANAPGGNLPLLGNDSGFQLGVRDGEGTEADGHVTPGTGGMSTSNTAASLPAFSVSRSYHRGSHNSTNQTTQAFRWKWSIDSDDLPDELNARNDHGHHVSIEPAEGRQLTRNQFRELVQGTQTDWHREPPP
jgi:hypothetical protein